MIEIKDHTVLESILRYPAHPKLAELILWVLKRHEKVLFTCFYEDRKYKSVHSVIPVRGMDLRSRIYEHPQAIVSDVNKHWIYDPTRPRYQCATLHDAGRGMHIHLQVRDSTRIVD